MLSSPGSLRQLMWGERKLFIPITSHWDKLVWENMTNLNSQATLWSSGKLNLKVPNNWVSPIKKNQPHSYTHRNINTHPTQWYMASYTFPVGTFWALSHPLPIPYSSSNGGKLQDKEEQRAWCCTRFWKEGEKQRRLDPGIKRERSLFGEKRGIWSGAGEGWIRTRGRKQASSKETS